AQAQLDQAANAVAQAQNGVTQAQAQLAQTEAPPDPASIAQAQAQVQQAQAALKAAQASEANTVLTAPISGVVVATNGTVGQQVAPGTAVVTLDDTVKGDLQINLEVPEADIGSVHAGEAVNVTVPAYPTTTFHGTVTQVYPTPQVVNNVNEYTVLATVHDPSGRLTPGMTANVTIVTATATHVLTVPPVALHTFGAVEGVYVKGTPGQAPRRPAVGNGTGRRFGRPGGPGSGTGGFAGGFRAAGLPAGVYFQPVTVGLFGTDAVQITRGLSAGQQIVLVLPGTTGTPTPTGTTGSAGRPGGGGFGFGGGLAGRALRGGG
ncbi:MAG: efflux RND transporter periplasmic adaptor subunit, partial [Actinomycetia bacterium]|nr:efflux RND transporter periplasmic adaptor subunit [Actinomycetes bacterium]